MPPSVLSLVYLLNYLWLCLRYVSYARVNNRLETEFKESEPHLKLKPALNCRNRFLGDLRRGFNSLNSDIGLFIKLPNFQFVLL